jgi:dihydroflavonol-4-reductase
MKIFITGATGFIGTHLVRRLSQTEHRMRCLVRTPAKADLLKEMGIEMVHGDVTDETCVRDGLQGCDWVIHIAGLYSWWQKDKQRYWDVHVTGTRNVMQAALDAGVAKVVHVSTPLIYGKPATTPFTEESPVGPVRFSEYARTKYEAEQIAWQLHQQKGLPLVVVSPAAILGPGDTTPSGQYIQDFVHGQLPGTAFGQSTMTWVHVRDVADAIVKALEKKDNLGEKYLVGKYSLTFQEYLALLSEISGAPLPRRVPDSITMAVVVLGQWFADLTGKLPAHATPLDGIRTLRAGFVFDGSKAERELGIAYTPMRVMLEDEVAFFKEQSLA